MRTAIAIVIGIALGAIVVFGSRKFQVGVNSFAAFAVIWALFCVIDTYVGVARAGYSLREEAPIHALIYVVPLAITWLLRRSG